MNNPWEDISLDDYEKHMSLDSVMQLQAMNMIMKQQFEDYPVENVMILGVAGGNGLEHISSEKYHKVYGVDINEDYLNAVSERYPELDGILECLCLDIISDVKKLPKVQLLTANLIIEYIGYKAFQKAVLQTESLYVSCLIQINTDKENWVSDSPYLHVFDRLDEIHHQMENEKLKETMAEIGYLCVLRSSESLPNGKALVRLDFRKGI